jgi:hypothetical protein
LASEFDPEKDRANLAKHGVSLVLGTIVDHLRFAGLAGRSGNFGNGKNYA